MPINEHKVRDRAYQLWMQDGTTSTGSRLSANSTPKTIKRLIYLKPAHSPRRIRPALRSAVRPV
jgi:hypothetical protein